MKDQQNIDRLPNDWKWVKLGEACEIVSGNTPKGLELISNEGEIQFYKVSDMNLVGNEIRMVKSNLKLTIEEIRKLKIKIYPKGTVIFPKRGGAILTNKKRILSQDSSFDLNVMGILPKEILSNNYLFYWIQKLDLSKIYDGSNVPQINNKNVAPLEFPIPPLPTQLLIVAKIEELFSELDKSIEYLRLAQQQLKTYRQSVLKWAFEGRLTNENVMEGELPVGWKKLKLKDVSKNISDGDHQAPPKSNSGIPFITISNVKKYNNKIDFSDTFFVNEEYYSKLKINRKPMNGDVLYTVTGSFGIPILIDFDKKFCFQRHIGLLRPLEITNQKWLYYLLQSSVVFNQAKSTATGTAQKTVALNSLRNFEIPYCTFKEQLDLVQEIECRLSVADKMEENITQSLQKAESLRQSILKKAFEGRLM